MVENNVYLLSLEVFTQTKFSKILLYQWPLGVVKADQHFRDQLDWYNSVPSPLKSYSYTMTRSLASLINLGRLDVESYQNPDERHRASHWKAVLLYHLMWMSAQEKFSAQLQGCRDSKPLTLSSSKASAIIALHCGLIPSFRTPFSRSFLRVFEKAMAFRAFSRVSLNRIWNSRHTANIACLQQRIKIGFIPNILVWLWNVSADFRTLFCT